MPFDSTRLSTQEKQAHHQFPMLITPNMAACNHAPDDAIARQFRPDAQELQSPNHYEKDPLQEAASSPMPGLVHKYQGRALLHLTDACPVHCRYCFRRHGAVTSPKDHATETALLTYLEQDTSLKELILSGGDPLMLPLHQWQWWMQRLSTLAHIERIRIHSRVPIADPARITQPLLDALTETKKTVIMVMHCNHSQELTQASKAAIRECREQGFLLLNQSVLLAGVNDTTEALANLSLDLIGLGVMPYYLHLLDAVEGAAHFEVDEQQAATLMRSLHQQLPGYALPKLVRERPNLPGKEPIQWF
ncbi:KamA family radical SAM protein [Magnetococcus sp. PR-3]|uniref:KamA family radical SAM protein n=1 Tax=Magnetococcus sp. PR-3 TaxID=3120355 RepID=UPI002FCE42C5